MITSVFDTSEIAFGAALCGSIENECNLILSNAREAAVKAQCYLVTQQALLQITNVYQQADEEICLHWVSNDNAVNPFVKDCGSKKGICGQFS